MEEKRQHTLSNCTQCMLHNYPLQKAFPLKPILTPQVERPIVALAGTNDSKADRTRAIVEDLNGVYLTTYGETFTDAMITHCTSERVHKKKTKYEVKKEKRAILRQCRDKVSEQMAETAAISILAEDESISKYQRKRMLQSFEKPPHPKKAKSHTSATTHFDQDNVLEDLRNHPTSTKINWSELARKHGVDSKNGGQVIKEFAQKEGIDTCRLECRTEEPKPRMRAQKRKLPGTKQYFI